MSHNIHRTPTCGGCILEGGISYTIEVIIEVIADNDCGWGSATCTTGKDGLIDGMRDCLSGQGLDLLGDTDAIERAAIAAANAKIKAGLNPEGEPAENLEIARVRRDGLTATICADIV